MSTETRVTISNGSKSFYLASLFFSSRTRDASWVLYRWCRQCDDRVDDAGSLEDLAELKALTFTGLEKQTGPATFSELGELFAQYNIPHQYAQDMLDGFEHDLTGKRIHTLEDLEKYAYQVAGVVGLMMSHVMGAPMPAAALCATNLGNAMQLTNIARDIQEDYERNRIYIPQEWLREAEINEAQLLSPDNRAAVFELVKRLLQRADESYKIGYAGLRFLPFRAALAVSIAGSIYSAIGKKILRGGAESLNRRVYVTLPEKIFLVFEGVARVCLRAIERLPVVRSHANAQ